MISVSDMISDTHYVPSD